MWEYKLSFKISITIHKKYKFLLKNLFETQLWLSCLSVSLPIFFVKLHPPFIKIQLNGMTSFVINKIHWRLSQATSNKNQLKINQIKTQHIHNVVCYTFLQWITMKSYTLHLCYLPVVLSKLSNIYFWK